LKKGLRSATKVFKTRVTRPTADAAPDNPNLPNRSLTRSISVLTLELV